MPRRRRELIDQGIYHVYARGNNRQEIFYEDKDFRLYCSLLLEAKARNPFDLFHYCLMTNHIHILLRIHCGKDLPVLMRWVQLKYARYNKTRSDYAGHLFQGRFRSLRIAEDSYYLQCGRYIERNPVKAGLCIEAYDYRYSSAGYYALGIPDPLISPNLHYSEMGKTREERRLNYRKFLQTREPYEQTVDEYLSRA